MHVTLENWSVTALRVMLNTFSWIFAQIYWSRWKTLVQAKKCCETKKFHNRVNHVFLRIPLCNESICMQMIAKENKSMALKEGILFIFISLVEFPTYSHDYFFTTAHENGWNRQCRKHANVNVIWISRIWQFVEARFGSADRKLFKCNLFMESSYNWRREKRGNLVKNQSVSPMLMLIYV